MKMHRTNRLCQLAIGMLAVSALSSPAFAQSTDQKHADHDQHQQSDKPDMQVQLRALQEKVAKLEAALKQKHAAMAMDGKAEMGMKGGMGMGMQKMAGMKKDDKSGMKMDKMSGGMQKGGGDNMKMAAKSGGGMGMMGENKGMGMGMMSKGMQMMGKMKSMGDMEMPSSLPGFPGASHIYHIGADSFFLDHAEHITLTVEQQLTLNKCKEDAMLKQADFDRQIEAAEQEVWVLTSSDSPDAKKIEDKISEVAKIQADQRIAYIRAVGDAAKTLTDQQRGALTGATNNEGAES